MSKLGSPLDAEQMKVFADKARKLLRARMRSTRGALPKAALHARSQQIVQRLLALPALERATRVALFWPLERNCEVDLRELDAALRARGVACYYPFMDPRSEGPEPPSFTTGFRRVDDVASLVDRGRGFAEPAPDAETAQRGDVDVILVPALAVTPAGARLGYGAGFYDATLPDLRPPALALIVAFSFQVVGELPLFEHDVSCDGVVTDEAVFDPEALLSASAR
jgi:5-formyltetrahydrofolate cyclo-ligase